MLLQIESEVLASRRVKLPQKLRAIFEGVTRVLVDTLHEKSVGVLFSETRKDRFAVGSAVKRESFPDRGQRHQPLLTSNLVSAATIR